MIRDSIGSLVAAGFKKIGRRWSVVMLEACAMRDQRGMINYLNVCKNSRFSLDVESDSESLINSINHHSSDLSKVQADEVLELAKGVNEINFSWCLRSGNVVALSLAREASMLSSSRPQVGDFFNSNLVVDYFPQGPSTSFLEVCFFGRDSCLPFWLSYAIIEDTPIGVG